MSEETLPADHTRVNALDLAISCLRGGTLSIDGEGRIWRHKDAGRAIGPRRAESPSGKGYLRLTFGIPGTRRTCSVMAHCVIWVWFVGSIPDGLQVNHKDLNKQNNCPDNLELTDQPGNIRHSYANGRTRPWSYSTEWRGRPRISPEIRREIRAARASGLILREIADRFGVSITHAQRICSGSE